MDGRYVKVRCLGNQVGRVVSLERSLKCRDRVSVRIMNGRLLKVVPLRLIGLRGDSAKMPGTPDRRSEDFLIPGTISGEALAFQEPLRTKYKSIAKQFMGSIARAQ